MTTYINSNLKVIKNHLKKRSKKISKKNSLSIINEFKEWDDDAFKGNEIIWTLPDLTQSDRLDNFCRAIKKEIK